MLSVVRVIRGRRALAGLALVATLAVVIGIVIGTSSPAPTQAASPPKKISGSTTVQRRNLVATDTESGTLSYANSQTVYNHLSGTVTWLPKIGQVVNPGEIMFRIANKPVVLFDGSTPAYRTLKPGISDGPDVLELNKSLVELGFNPDGIVEDNVWQTATTLGVEAWQHAMGDKETGEVSLGQVVFLPGKQRITTVTGTLGSTVATLLSAPRPEFVSLETTTTTPTTTTTTTTTTPTTTTPTTTTPTHNGTGSGSGANNSQTLAALIALLRAELAQLKASQSPKSSGGNSPSASNSGSPSASNSGSPAASKGGGGGSGGSGGAGTAIMTTTSTQLVVTVDLDATKQSEATVGEPVTVELPSGDVVDGKITEVSPVAVSSSNNGSGSGSGGGGGGSGSPTATIPVTITLRGRLHREAGLDQAAVSVNFAQQKANHVLSVPVTALLATGGGGYGVQEAAAPHKLIAVTPGLFAAGYVQISGSGIYPGLQVTDSQG